eukprot:Gb_38651 [translate_table: standard]
MGTLGLIGGVILQTAADQLLGAIKDVMKKSFLCKSYCKRLQRTLEAIIPILEEISQTGAELSQHRQQQLQEFHGELRRGIQLVQNCSNVNRLHVFKSYKYSKKILELEKRISNFPLKQGWAHILSDIHHLRVDVRNVDQNVSTGFTMFQQVIDDQTQIRIAAEPPDSSLQIPELPNFFVGLNNSVEKLKEQLFRENVSLLGVKGLGGSGKTTLAVALCNDSQVREHFNKRIIFETVSQSPNIRGLLESMWKKITGEPAPYFNIVEDARIQLQYKLRQIFPQPTLVVLDDVWKRIHLEKLLFEAEGYKTVVTSRCDFPVFDFAYDLQMLGEGDALSLFCFSAFGQKSIPESENGNLVKQVQVVAECKGLPLALKVIGGSLRHQPAAAWTSAKNKLSQGEPISEYHEEGLLKCMAMSIDVLENEVRQCFLDLGSFPEDKRTSVDALLDIWVYVHGLEWEEAYVILIELAKRNLLSLVKDPTRISGSSYASSCELSFVQHDVLRDLALYLAKEEQISKQKRLIMPKKQTCLPKRWRKHRGSSFEAQIISIHTGCIFRCILPIDAMDEDHWGQMDFPEVEALIINFAGGEYFLPSFIETMHELKVLIVVSHSSKRATLKGLSVLSSLSQLKSVYFERVIAPPLHEHSESLQNLEKLSLILCEGCGNMNGLLMDLCLNLHGLLEIIIDHCSDLEELPASICSMASLRKLVVTNCPNLQKLSDDLGKLSSLQTLRLYACPCLGELPYSICKLRQLEFLEISLCECMKKLPEEFGQLSSLKELDMRECSRIRQLPKSVHELRSLWHVVCDEKIGHGWSYITASTIPQLWVEVAEEHFHLDWLED